VVICKAAFSRLPLAPQRGGDNYTQAI